MTSDEFFSRLVELYRRARMPTFETEGITRARCRSVSGGLEDLVAAYIVRNLPGRFHIFVDQPVSIGRGVLRYPDLVLCDNDRKAVCSFVDVKTDLGWKRDEIEAMSIKLRQLADATAAKMMKLGPTPNTRRSHDVVERPACHLVVAAWPNSGKTSPAAAAAIALESGVEFYVLSEGRHPNHFSRGTEDVFADLVIRRSDMARLLRNVARDSTLE